MGLEGEDGDIVMDKYFSISDCLAIALTIPFIFRSSNAASAKSGDLFLAGDGESSEEGGAILCDIVILLISMGE